MPPVTPSKLAKTGPFTLCRTQLRRSVNIWQPKLVRWSIAGARVHSIEKTMHAPKACGPGGERLWKLISPNDRMKRRVWEVIERVRKSSLHRKREALSFAERAPQTLHSGKIECS